MEPINTKDLERNLGFDRIPNTRAQGTEEQLQKQINELLTKLSLANARSENAEMDIGRLNVRIDKVEEDLIIEKGKIKQVSDELNGLFNSMMDDGY